ncbi:hypothetical protein TNCV_332761 [Trichonephila clavipes]|nr:hypothetical protein TNCV_332761 [Trichonephila clavipes]
MISELAFHSTNFHTTPTREYSATADLTGIQSSLVAFNPRSLYWTLPTMSLQLCELGHRIHREGGGGDVINMGVKKVNTNLNNSSLM